MYSLSHDISLTTEFITFSYRIVIIVFVLFIFKLIFIDFTCSWHISNHVDSYAFFLTERMQRKVFRIKSVWFKCCSLLCWSFLFAGRHFTSSTRLRYSIRKLSIKRLATQPLRIFNCLHIPVLVAIQLLIVSWIEVFERHFWICSGASSDSMSRAAWASEVVLVLVRQVQLWLSVMVLHNSANPMFIDSKHKGCALIHHNYMIEIRFNLLTDTMILFDNWNAILLQWIKKGKTNKQEEENLCHLLNATNWNWNWNWDWN